jgi:peptide deformylase
MKNMALREVRKIGDEVLRKKSRIVDKVDERIKQLLEDMVETMHAENGVGLAAPQVGILKRVIVLDVGHENGVLKLINPEIIEHNGIQQTSEGCLSVPGVNGEVERPFWLKVKGIDENGLEVEYEGDNLFSRAVCHEIDHLDGILFVDKMKDEE